MSYYHARRAEILGSRKRRPRRCDVLRWLEIKASQLARVRHMRRAANRLSRALGWL